MEKLNYRLKVFTVQTEDGTEWIAEYPDLRYCGGSGQTPEEAVKEAEANKEIYLEELMFMGKALPVPTNPDEAEYSGKFVVRISKTLHKRMSILAEEEGISLNQLASEAFLDRVNKSTALMNPMTLNLALSSVKYNVSVTQTINKLSWAINQSPWENINTNILSKENLYVRR